MADEHKPEQQSFHISRIKRSVVQIIPYLIILLIFLLLSFYFNANFYTEYQFKQYGQQTTAYVDTISYANFEDCQDINMVEQCISIHEYPVEFSYHVNEVTFSGEGAIPFSKAPEQVKLLKNLSSDETQLDSPILLELEYLSFNPNSYRLLVERNYDLETLYGFLSCLFMLFWGLIKSFIISSLIFYFLLLNGYIKLSSYRK